MRPSRSGPKEKAAVPLSDQIHQIRQHLSGLSDPAVDSGLMLAAGRHRLASIVERALFERCALAGDASILIGCSGGPDSSALSVLIAALAGRRDSSLRAPVLVHVDHGLRPGGSIEAEGVSRLAARLGLGFRGVSLGMDPLQADLAGSARRLRYDALHDVACELRYSCVACAHHAEDRFETIIHGLCRGVGVEALSNPTWQRSLGSVSLLRPLLDVSREDLRDFCCSLEIDFFDDPTNVDPATMRGSLRDSVLPRLEERWPGASRRASAAIDRISVASDSLDREISGILKHASIDSIDLSLLVINQTGFISALIRRWILTYAETQGHDLRDHLSSSFFDQVARAVCDKETKPRLFHCAGLLTVRLDVHSLVIGPMFSGES